MQFNSESNNQDIISDITFLLSGIDTNEYSLNDRTRAVNLRNYQVWSMIFESYGGWLFMDSNIAGTTGTGDVPYADQTVTANQPFYVLPTGALAVTGVEIKYTGASSWIPITPMSHEEFLSRGGDATFPTASTPWAYLLQGNILRLLPMPNYTQAASLRVFFDPDIYIFVPSDTTKTPGFAAPFHRMLSVGGALDFGLVRGLPKAMTLQALWTDYETRLRRYYANRYKAYNPDQIKPGEDLVQEFM